MTVSAVVTQQMVILIAMFRAFTITEHSAGAEKE